MSPDLAGWKRERLPELPPEGEPFRTVPDWAGEVLSTSNARYDQQTKAPFYASVGVPWLWMVDTRSRRRVYRLFTACNSCARPQLSSAP